MKTYPLGIFIKRVLLIRLFAVTAAISLIIGCITYFVQKSVLSNQLTDLGRPGIAALIYRVQMTMNQKNMNVLSALQEVVSQSEPPMLYRSGHFVTYQIYDRTPSVLAESSVTDFANIRKVKTFLNAHPFSFPEAGKEEADLGKIDGDLFVYITAPVIAPSGTTAAYARGIFAVSSEAKANMRKRILETIILVVAIVICVAALLYPVILHLVRKLANYSSHLLDSNLETLSVLGSAIAKRDSDTDAHNYRVTLYATRIGELIGLPNSSMCELIKGAFLHDVGKIGIPDHILLKPGKLDDDEFSIMRTHVEKGIDIIKRSAWLNDGITIVGSHHEKFGGGGYPKNLSGEQIPITARIFAIADVFDALTSVRPYKNPLSFEQSMGILQEGCGKHFDPKILDVFATVARELYDRYCGREGESLREDLSDQIQKYFSAGIDTLSYDKS